MITKNCFHMNTHTPEMIFEALSDKLSLRIFRSIGDGEGNRDGLKSSSTRKQYYSRMRKIQKTGLVSRSKGKYSLTTFGKVVLDAELQIEDAFENYWKLKAIDSIGASKQIAINERNKLIKRVLNNEKLEKIIIKG